MRDGVDRRVPVDAVVVGDLVRLTPGDQVVSDGTVVSADGLALDEASLTGESEPVVRGVGEPGFESGTFAIEGVAAFDATAVGEESRRTDGSHGACVSASAIPARACERPPSVVAGGHRRPARRCAQRVCPAPCREPRGARVQALTAAIVNLVPEGLILLISLTAAVSGLQDGPARRARPAAQRDRILASVDVPHRQDRTLTEPTLRAVRLVPARDADDEPLCTGTGGVRGQRAVLNPTLQAIADASLADVETQAVRRPGAVLLTPALERARPGR